MAATGTRLGRTLVRAGVITEDQLTEALGAAEGRPLPAVLDEMGFASESSVAQALAESMGLTFVDLGVYEMDPNAATKIPVDVARRYRALPIKVTEDELVVAMADPNDIFALDDISIMSGYDVRPVVALEADILAALDKFAASQANVDDMVGDLE